MQVYYISFAARLRKPFKEQEGRPRQKKKDKVAKGEEQTIYLREDTMKTKLWGTEVQTPFQDFFLLTTKWTTIDM